MPAQGGRYTADTQRGAPGPARERAPFSIAVAGGKGGVGATTLAVELSGIAAGENRSVVLVDLSTSGDAHFRLDVPLREGGHTLAEVLPLAGELDRRLLDTVLLQSPGGPLLLPPSSSPLDLSPLPRLVAAMCSFFDAVIVDAGRIAPDVEAAFSSCHTRLLVTTPDVAGVGTTGRMIEAMDSISDFDVSLAINHSLGGGDLVSRRDVESYLGLAVVGVLPEDAASCRSAGDRGAFIHRGRSRLAAALREFGRLLLTQHARFRDSVQLDLLPPRL